MIHNKERYMIEFGSYGWGNFECDEFSGRFSYLEDTPIDLLHAFECYLEKHIPVAIYMDEEGSSWILVLTHYSVYVIVERDDTNLIEINILPDDFIREILYDIENQFEETVLWISYDPDEDLQQRKRKIAELLNRCKELLGRKS